MLIVAATVKRGSRIRQSNTVVAVGSLELCRLGVEEVVVKGESS